MPNNAGFYPVYLNTTELYAAKMSMALRAGGRTLTPEIALRENVDAWQIVKLDPGFRHAIDHSKRVVVGHTWKLEPASTERADIDLCDIIREIIDEIPNFNKAMLSMADVMFLGEYNGFINGHRKKYNFSKKGIQDYWVPYEIRHISRDRVRKMNREDGSIAIHLFRPQNPKGRRHEELKPDQYAAFLYMTNSDEESRFTAGDGLLDPLYVCHTFKSNALTEQVNQLERFGQGKAVLGIDEENEGDELRDLQDLNDTYANVLRDDKARHVFIKRKQDTYELLDPSGQGSEIINRSIDYWDTKAMLLCLGAELNVVGGSSGSYNQAVEHRMSTNNHLRPTRVGIEELMSHQVIKRNIWRHNYPQFVRLGLGNARPPKFQIPEDREDNYEVNIQRLGEAREWKLDVKETEVYKLLGLTVPSEDDKTVQIPLENMAYPVDPTDELSKRLFESGDPVHRSGDEIPEGIEEKRARKEDDARTKIDIEIEGEKKKAEAGLETDDVDTEPKAELEKEAFADEEETGSDIGVERDEMPQLKGSDLDNFLEELGKQDVQVESKTVPVLSLQPSQENLDPAKVDSLIANLGDITEKPIVVSGDNYIVDGHHRWAAIQKATPVGTIKVIQIHLPIAKLLVKANSFLSKTGDPITGGFDPVEFAQDKLKEFTKNPSRKNKFDALRAIEMANAVQKGGKVWK